MSGKASEEVIERTTELVRLLEVRQMAAVEVDTQGARDTVRDALHLLLWNHCINSTRHDKRWCRY